MAIHFYQGDIPADLDFGDSIAIDTETQGLNLQRDRLCLIQLSAGDGDAHLVQFKADEYDAPNLKKVLSDPKSTKIFHFARFDIASIQAYLGVSCTPVFCTRIASLLTRTYTDKHGLKDICAELLGIEISKQQQQSDWAAEELSLDQQEYAAADVLYLHRLMEVLIQRLEREGRMANAQACFNFLPHRADLDLEGWGNLDIFAH
ncbi:MAG: ribonuclease D [Rhodospirillaceae bacterium]|nr:ribonuclease D [Rhodospirillaceae bacterium]MBT4589519.1 ribonuclease D [Rhodospirillaceae bacterium]MBT4939865.1 ribonuclease D [Rhodospirillaceae bacterium]MBT5941613.1 ribonuclease D [Rhodospirillaceae bacterium]MBT7268779.1 ribonuclease D [Rhodospirillaceae bacterium]